MNSFSVCFCSTLVPRHPLSGVRGEFAGVPLQFGQIVERVGPAQLAGMNEAHEQIAHLSAVQRLIKQRILATTQSFP